MFAKCGITRQKKGCFLTTSKIRKNIFESNFLDKCSTKPFFCQYKAFFRNIIHEISWKSMVYATYLLRDNSSWAAKDIARLRDNSSWAANVLNESEPINKSTSHFPRLYVFFAREVTAAVNGAFCSGSIFFQ